MTTYYFVPNGELFTIPGGGGFAKCCKPGKATFRMIETRGGWSMECTDCHKVVNFDSTFVREVCPLNPDNPEIARRAQEYRKAFR